MKKAFQVKLPDWDVEDVETVTDCSSDCDENCFHESNSKEEDDEDLSDAEFNLLVDEIRTTFEDQGTSNCLRTSCLAHSLQLVVKDGLATVEVNFTF